MKWRETDDYQQYCDELVHQGPKENDVSVGGSLSCAALKIVIWPIVGVQSNWMIQAQQSILKLFGIEIVSRFPQPLFRTWQVLIWHGDHRMNLETVREIRDQVNTETRPVATSERATEPEQEQHSCGKEHQQEIADFIDLARH